MLLHVHAHVQNALICVSVIGTMLLVQPTSRVGTDRRHPQPTGSDCECRPVALLFLLELMLMIFTVVAALLDQTALSVVAGIAAAVCAGQLSRPLTQSRGLCCANTRAWVVGRLRPVPMATSSTRPWARVPSHSRPPPNWTFSKNAICRS